MREKKEEDEGESVKKDLALVSKGIAMHRAGRPGIISQVSFDKLAPGIRYPRFTTLVLSITSAYRHPLSLS